MFERLAGKLLGNILSKYFTDESLSKNKVAKSASLGVWSGYISLQNLQLKQDVINDLLDRKCIPIELVQCSFRQVEITIPWAKLSNPISSGGRTEEDGAVIVVLDGIHLLVRTKLKFNDFAMRIEAIEKRRKAINEANLFVEESKLFVEESKGDSKVSFAEAVKKRITSGLLHEVADKLHVTMRDLHIRIEDIESDPSNPYAFGITMESMHIHQNEDTVDSSTSTVARKVVQLNHFALYWNICDYGPGLPVENSILHETCSDDPDRLSRSLNFCISRRSSLIASPSRKPYIPNHTYILLPVDGITYLNVSTTPDDLRIYPALEATVTLESVSTQIRDFQCVQILRLIGEVKNHSFVKKYRQFRPLVSVKENPKAWWIYAARVIRYQLKENFLRWSWSRFEEGYKARRRYMNLYKRKICFPSSRQEETLSRLSQITKSDILERSQHPQSDKNTELEHSAPPDAGAGPKPPLPLSDKELVEIQNIEDGIQGDLSVKDILLFRALVNVRLGRTSTPMSQNGKVRSWISTVESIADDSEAKEEISRFLKIVEGRKFKETSLLQNQHQIAVSVIVRLERICVSFWSPSHLTKGERPLRRLHERFLDFTILDTFVGISIKGDYKTMNYQLSVKDVVAVECRADRTEHIIASQVLKENEVSANFDPSQRDLLFVKFIKNAPSTSSCDEEIKVTLNMIEIKLIPECQWIGHAKNLFKEISRLPNVADFWKDLSLAYVNSLALGRLGLLAKAESIAYDHKNIQIDVSIECPVIYIGDGSGYELIFDLGTASLKTEKLAGVSRAKVHDLKALESTDSTSLVMTASSMDDDSVMGTLIGPTPMKYRFEVGKTPSRSKRSFSVSSAISVGSKAFRSNTGASQFDDALSFHGGGVGSNVSDGGRKARENSQQVNEIFYDVYQFRLESGKVTLSGDTNFFDISPGFQLSTTFKKSIIPSDHTICKLKANTVIEKLSLALNERTIVHIGKALKTWKKLVSVDVHSDSQSFFHGNTRSYIFSYPSLPLVTPKHSVTNMEEGPIKDNLSQVDESEFFDANDGYDSFGESSGVWFDEHWISDAESAIDVESRSLRSNRRHRKRRGSISEASSNSDNSGKALYQQGNYLSAENLARLEEAASEDNDSLEASDVDSEESFYSVMSTDGQLQVLQDLENGIIKSKDRIIQLSETLRQMTGSNIDANENNLSQIRKTRRAMKLEMNRTKAELNILTALYADLKSLLEEAPANFSTGGDNSADDTKLLSRSLDYHARTAQAILEAKTQRDTSHHLSSGLNREVFQGSILFSEIQITIHLNDESKKERTQVIQLIASQNAIALVHHLYDTKLYFSLDELTLSVGNQLGPQVPSRLLMSCGSHDALLPTHFPHLISRSTEERFLRGALHIGKARDVDTSGRITRSLKLRLILGDIEMSPSEQYVSPISSFLSKIGISKESSSSTDTVVDPSKSTGQASKYLDVAIRLTSLRVVLSHANQVIGAFGISELSTRMLHLSSSMRNRSQLELQCNNLQLLEITSLESAIGNEIIGRRDPYNFLLQLRVRSQLVPSSEAGGWVAGAQERKKDFELDLSEAVWNVHVGIRLNPLSLVASSAGLLNIVKSGSEMKDTLSRINMAPKSTESVSNPKSSIIRNPLRWRIDVTLRRIAISFPTGLPADKWNITDESPKKMTISYTIVLSLQESASSEGFLSLQAAMTDISIIRCSDDFPILEPFSVIGETAFRLDLNKYGIKSLSGSNSSLLQFPLESSMNEIATVLQRYEWKSILVQESNEIEVGMKVTCINISLSAPIIGLLFDTMQSMKEISSIAKLKREENNVQSSINPSPAKFLGVHISVQGVRIPVFYETETSRHPSNTKPLFSFSMTDIAFDFEQREKVFAYILIRSSDVVDFSSLHGIRVIGEDPNSLEAESPYFMRAKVYMTKQADGATVMRLGINWGRIQCLVIPSFLNSILTLQTDSKLIISNLERSKPKENNKDAFINFLAKPNDVNFILSVDAEAFECILPSQDILEYVKESKSDPIGVVALRWKVSLSVAVAFDCLKEGSVPWISLDLDGTFTDEKDRVLFKDFADRYLTKNLGFLAGSDESRHKLVNAFTAKIGLGVTDFQVLRTDILSMSLDTSLMDVSNSSYLSKSQLCFKVISPAEGEQRITNEIDLDIIYRAVGSSMTVLSEGDLLFPQIEISQLLKFKANSVDILAYISQGKRGFTEAMKVTIKPILELMKGDKVRKKKDDSKSRETPLISEKDDLKALIRRASSMCSVQLEGFVITCVPGGSSRLNESPIIKFEVSDFSSGIAAIPVLKDARQGLISPKAQLGQTSGHLISGYDVMHLTLSGWVDCNISAHYHNRRLVAWEPFIEPWAATIRIGSDLVNSKKVSPQFRRLSNDLQKDDFHPWVFGPFNEGSKDRLREFGRIFRVPFQSAVSKPSQNISQSDFCYLMLVSSARSTLLSVQFPSSGSTEEKDSRLFLSLPSQDSMGWLRNFGFPESSRKENRNSDQYSISCILSDQKPLNINLTGALIENLLGYVDNAKRDAFDAVAPHWIHNESGLNIRFQEVLDSNRTKRGESAGKVILSNGSKVPLTLKRSISQSCDPHKAFIYLELGSFEDTVGRVNPDDFSIPRGSRSSTFFYKAAAKIPVDTVGVYRYPLDKNIDPRADLDIQHADSRSLGWIIVRVALSGGTKVISVESPFVLKSSADADLLCEVRDYNYQSIIWRCLVPKQGTHGEAGFVSVPADIVPFIHDESYSFTITALARCTPQLHEVDLQSEQRDEAIQIAATPPFSPQSFRRGLINEREVVLSTITPRHYLPSNESSEKVHLSVCSLRIGNLSSGDTTVTKIPEQRMLFFRSPLVVRNFLARPIAIQVRVKISTEPQTDTLNTRSIGRRGNKFLDWEDIGILDCGKAINWTGALSTENVQLRVRFVGLDGDTSRRFPEWSSAVNIPTSKLDDSDLDVSGEAFARLRLYDTDDIPLDLSVALEKDNKTSEGDLENIRTFSRRLESAQKVVSIFVPYWIVDSTDQDLEFFAGAPVAGQLDRNGVSPHGRASDNLHSTSTLGLAELFDNDNFLGLPSRSPFDVMMIGDKTSTRLTVRKRLPRKNRSHGWRHSSPWSDPIPLRADRESNHDTIVLSQKEAGKVDSDDLGGFDRFVFRSTVINAPKCFGGQLGTMLIHVVNRYAIINEMGRDLEIMTDIENGSTIFVRATNRPQSFHFDDMKPICFRFKEYGWNWSGKFHVKKNVREVTIRLRQKMKGDPLIVTVEVRMQKKSSICLIIFRESSHPPFRIENLTMHPLYFGQLSTLVTAEEPGVDAMLLPYQSADFAWDEPELRRRALIIKSKHVGKSQSSLLGRFYLDRLAPGAILRLRSKLFSGEVVADGPTRVLRITDATMPRITSSGKVEVNDFQQKEKVDEPVTVSLLAKFAKGVGISVVDWSPQELLYARLDDIQIERNMDSLKDTFTFTVGNIKVNNQLWVTPYPVLLKMGKSESNSLLRRNRKNDAINLLLQRPLKRSGGYGNVSLFERLEVASQPVILSLDGTLAGLLYGMIRQIGGITVESSQGTLLSRDEKLKEIFSIFGDQPSRIGSESLRKASPLAVFNQDADGELITTVAIAAKLRTRPLPLVKIQPQALMRRKTKRQPLSKPTQKYYIEKLKISATKADISWSGSLPGRVHNLLFRGLTFEGLPVHLRPYSISHSYGSIKDHTQSIRSHYLSFWRIIDLLIGVSYNPSFFSRAFLYTCRETIASSLESLSNSWINHAKDLMKIIPTKVDLQPRYDDGLPIDQITPSSLVLRKVALEPFLKGAAFSFRFASSLTMWMSSLLKYIPQQGRRRATHGFVRSRSPRLFARMNGKDLLVEFVEGESAGKALLSRVRMGVHLGEGYIFHTEEARQPKLKPKTSLDLDPDPMIIMMTSERILLLSGKLDADFCTVEWETTLLNLSHVEFPEDEEDTSLQPLVFWYLSDANISGGDDEEPNTRHSDAFATGIDMLNRKCIYVPKAAGRQMMIKIQDFCLQKQLSSLTTI